MITTFTICVRIRHPYDNRESFSFHSISVISNKFITIHKNDHKYYKTHSVVLHTLFDGNWIWMMVNGGLLVLNLQGPCRRMCPDCTELTLCRGRSLHVLKDWFVAYSIHMNIVHHSCLNQSFGFKLFARLANNRQSRMFYVDVQLNFHRMEISKKLSLKLFVF